MAGGKGKRLWPLSTDQVPKQFVTLTSDTTLLQNTIDRFAKYEELYVVTNEVGKELVNEVNLIVEPESKNTAFAIVHAVKMLIDKGLRDDETIIVTPCDQVYSEFELPVDPRDEIQLFGVPPLYPSPDYGYIVRDKKGKVRQFIEKPERSSASNLMGHALWNTGVLAFKLKRFLVELERHAPLYRAYIEGTIDYTSLPNLSIDHALVEKSERLICSKLDTTFYDIGTWQGLYNHLDKDENENAKIGAFSSIDSKRNLIISKNKPIRLVGVSDHVVIETDETFYIAPLKNGNR